jgi:hypothetical protein
MWGAEEQTKHFFFFVTRRKIKGPTDVKIGIECESCTL